MKINQVGQLKETTASCLCSTAEIHLRKTNTKKWLLDRIRGAKHSAVKWPWNTFALHEWNDNFLKTHRKKKRWRTRVVKGRKGQVMEIISYWEAPRSILFPVPTDSVVGKSAIFRRESLVRRSRPSVDCYLVPVSFLLLAWHRNWFLFFPPPPSTYRKSCHH